MIIKNQLILLITIFSIELSYCQQQQQQYGIKTTQYRLQNQQQQQIGWIDQSDAYKFSSQMLKDLELSGICFKEVPTASLVNNSNGYVPAGNGSSPSLSRIQICCNGYEQNPHNFKKCDPICTNGCVNGRCIAPEKCQCYPDHVLNLGGHCIPTCPIGCGNGLCQSDRSCLCQPGYILEPKKQFCMPLCSSGCRNGNCTAPDTCQCNQGFRLYENKCIPESGKYILDTSFSVTTESQQQCSFGYSSVNGICKPICLSGCPNGFCTSPGVCICNQGYFMNSGVCDKIRNNIKTSGNLEQYKINDEYEFRRQGNAAFLSSGICFKEVPTAELIKNTTGWVVSNSKIPPGNGSNPTLSRIQVCCDGYEPNVHNAKQCDPICSNGCPNGRCIGPDICECFPDHVVNLGGYCMPTCPIGCQNGICSTNNICLCKPGFKPDISKRFCIPECESGCQNGNCTIPNICECNKGYSLNSLKQCILTSGYSSQIIQENSCAIGYYKNGTNCVPICKEGCKNGVCIAPDTCTCNPGWYLDATKTICFAKCDQKCFNGFCTAPNTCTCYKGYAPSSVNHYSCISDCPNGCPNGTCSGPNICLCRAGFIKDRSIKGSQDCVPRNY